MNNPQQPGKYDAVLGGNSLSLEGAAVLGGIDGLKLRLKNPDVKVRIAAIKEAFNYGEHGLDLLIEVVEDKSLEISTDYKYKQEVKETSSYWYKTWNIDWDYYNKLPEEEEKEREEFFQAEYKAWEAEEREREEQERLENQWENDDIHHYDNYIDEDEDDYIDWEEQERQWEEEDKRWEEQKRQWKQWEEEDRQLEAQIKQWEKQEREREEQERQWEKQERQWEEEQRIWNEKYNIYNNI